MSAPCTKRPEASAINGHVWVFVGGSYQSMTPEAAEALRDKLTDAIEKARSQ